MNKVIAERILENASKVAIRLNSKKIKKYGPDNCEIAYNACEDGYGARSIALEVLSPNNHKNWHTAQVDAMIDAWEIYLALGGDNEKTI